MHPTLVWLTVFVWTVAIELPVYAALLRSLVRDTRQLCLAVLAANLLTHPALFLMDPSAPIELLAAEVMAALVEAVTMAAWLGWPALGATLLAALAANLISMLAGLALSAWLAR